VSLDDRFDELVTALSGFYQTWVVYLGLELGLFDALRSSHPAGLTAVELAERSGCRPEPVAAWARAAHAFELADITGDRLTIDADAAVVLLDEQRPEYLGGQFVSTIVASLDYEGMTDFFRTGRPIAPRPERYRRAVERLTTQDIAVFFEEGLANLPDLVADLVRGGRIVDIHCGGARWLIAMARQFPRLELVGIELEPDTIDRALANVAAAGLAERIRIEGREIVATERSEELFDLAYFQYALHQIADPVGSLRAAWGALRTGGRLAVLDWCLPSSPADDRTILGQLLWGIQLDELYMSSRKYTRDELLGLFAQAGLPVPDLIDLPSGATLLVATRGR
jgi:SAM-dependent methyltransferase